MVQNGCAHAVTDAHYGGCGDRFRTDSCWATRSSTMMSFHIPPYACQKGNVHGIPVHPQLLICIWTTSPLDCQDYMSCSLKQSRLFIFLLFLTLFLDDWCNPFCHTFPFIPWNAHSSLKCSSSRPLRLDLQVMSSSKSFINPPTPRSAICFSAFRLDSSSRCDSN